MAVHLPWASIAKANLALRHSKKRLLLKIRRLLIEMETFWNFLLYGAIIITPILLTVILVTLI